MRELVRSRKAVFETSLHILLFLCIAGPSCFQVCGSLTHMRRHFKQTKYVHLLKPLTLMRPETWNRDRGQTGRQLEWAGRAWASALFPALQQGTQGLTDLQVFVPTKMVVPGTWSVLIHLHGC